VLEVVEMDFVHIIRTDNYEECGCGRTTTTFYSFSKDVNDAPPLCADCMMELVNQIFVRHKCPSCNKEFAVLKTVEATKIICPYCGEVV